MTAKILFLDCETLPIHAAVWSLWKVNVSINQIIKPGRTACVAWKWSDSKKVEFVSEWGCETYKEFLQKIHSVLDECDILVTYNGIRFDLPVLNREFVLHGLPPPRPMHHIDLLKVVKRKFRFDSAKLDFVSQQLGLGAKVSHRGMELWSGVDRGCPKSQKEMMVYNKQDVVLLERLYYHIRSWIPNHPTVPLLEGRTDVPSCPSCGGNHLQHRGYRTTKTRRYKRYQCQDCGSWSSETTSDKEIVAGVVCT